VFGPINQKHGGFDIVFLPQFVEKDLGKSGCCGRKQPQMENIVCLWICSSVQPELLVVDPNHRFVDRNLIQSFAADWL
jgi:hypothetical protein